MVKRSESYIQLHFHFRRTIGTSSTQYDCLFIQQSNLINITMLSVTTYLLVFFVALATYLFYSWILRPKKIMKHYAEAFRKQGYNVVELPYKIGGAAHFAQTIRDTKQHGDPFYRHKHHYCDTDVIVTNVLNTVDLVLTNAELINQVTTPENAMVLQKAKRIFQVFFSIANRAIFSIEGNEWKHRRKLLSQVFNYNFVTAHIPMMAQIADRVMDQFEKKRFTSAGVPGNSEKEGEKGNKIKVDLFELMMEYTSSIVVSGFLGLDSLNEKLKGEPLANQIVRLASMALASFNEPLLLLFGQKLLNKGWRKFDRELLSLRNGIKQVLRGIIKNQQEIRVKQQQNNTNQQNKTKSILSLLLAQRAKNHQSQSSENFEITDDELVDQMINFVTAGSETTSNFLVAMIFYLFEKPETAAKLRKQIDSIVNSDADITIENMKKMAFLECVVLEVSRMFCSAVGSFQRNLTEDIVVGGVPIKKGTMIFNIWVSQFYNPKVFENPFEFMPERWEGGRLKEKEQLVSLIFSRGPRNCLGKHLALTEMKVMTVKFMQRYDKAEELGAKDRAFRVQLALHIQNCQAELVRAEL